MNKKLDKKGFDLLTELEGCILHPYQDKKGNWTIGLGCTYYENGVKVTKNDAPITEARAYELYLNIAVRFEDSVNKSVKTVITQNQYNALFCFCWNVGTGGFERSTLLRVVNQNPNDKKAIADAFLLWKGKDNGLLSRQNEQIKHYFL